MRIQKNKRGGRKRDLYETDFYCPNDGPLTQSMVNFVCNICRGTDAIKMNGMYVCPDCLKSSEPFECRLCGSRKVTYNKKLSTNL